MTSIWYLTFLFDYDYETCDTDIVHLFLIKPVLTGILISSQQHLISNIELEFEIGTACSGFNYYAHFFKPLSKKSYVSFLNIGM